MAFRYEYKPAGDGTKKVAIVIATIILIFSLYSLGTNITGYFTYSGAIEFELNKTKADLDVYKAVSEQCTRDLWQKEQNLSRCEITLGTTYASFQACNQQTTILIGQYVSLNASLSACLSEIEVTRGLYGNATFSYRNLVRNSVKEICCTFGDVQNSIVRSWNITNDQIVCFGSFSINCTSGEMTL